MKLRPYQEIGAQFLRERKYALLADEPGLGKTAQAIEACIDHSPEMPTVLYNILVICPAPVKYQWQDQFEIWRRWKANVIVDSKQRVTHGHPVIVNYDLMIRPMIFKQLMGFNYDLIICDEAHRIKNSRAKRTQAVLDHLLKRTKRMWFLTGTPVKNRPVDLYPMLSSCVPEIIKPYNSYLRFAYRYCGAYMGAFGLVATGATKMDDLGTRLKSFMLRRLQADVLTELPKRIVQKIEFECTKEVEALIAQEEEKTIEAAGDDAPFFSLGTDARVRQVLGKYKIKDGGAFIEDRLEEVQKVVVFFHHHSVMHELNKRFAKYNPISISGKDSPAVRQQKIKTFVNDPSIRILLGQMQACGEGVDGLQHVCHTCIFIEPSWSPTEIDQCIHRLERMGQKEVVNAYILTIRDTVESRMMETAEWKNKVYNKLYNATEQEHKPTEEPMYLEEKLDQIIKQNAKVIELFSILVNDQSAKPAGGTPTPAAAEVKTTKTTRTTKITPAPAVAEEIVDHTEEECRALVSQMVTKSKTGKTKAVEIIQSQGIEKLNEANQVQRNAIFAGLEAALKDGGDTTDDV